MSPAADGLAEYILREQGRPMDLSPRFIWNETRSRMGVLDANVAVDMPTGIEVAFEQGFALERDFPSPLAATTSASALEALVQERPSPALREAALRCRPLPAEAEKQVLTSTLPALKGLLAEGRPALLVVKYHASAAKVGPDGRWPLPAPDDPFVGGHAVLCVGYDDVAGHLILRNSWGERWGDRGYGYMPYQALDQGLVMFGFGCRR